MAIVGDKYILTVTSLRSDDTEGANPLINVFAYEATSGSPAASDLNAIFQTEVFPSWIDCVNITYVLREVAVVNLDDVADFFLDAINFAGGQTGDPLNSFMAFEFEYIRAVRGAHNGRKSIAGIDEAMLTAGDANVTQTGLLDILAADFGSLLNSGLASYTPKIWRRAGSYAPYSGDPPVGTPYPDTFYPIQSVRYNRVSTQNTRKK